MSTTASICTSRLHGNMTHLATTRETDAEFSNIGAGWGVVVVVMGWGGGVIMTFNNYHCHHVSSNQNSVFS